MDESRTVALVKDQINGQIEDLLNKVKDPQAKEYISRFFLRDLFNYAKEISRLASRLSEVDADPEEIDSKFERLTTEILLKGCCLEELVDNKIIMRKIRDDFRALAGRWLYEGPILKKSLEKLRRYPGNYFMLESIYDNQPLGKTGIGLYADKYFLNSPYVVALRLRKDKLGKILEEEIKGSSSETIRIFDIACGSCREMRELPFSLFENKEVIFTCLDWDKEALEFSQKLIGDFPSQVKFDFKLHDVTNLRKDVHLAGKFEKQNLVYSVSLIDYLPDRILKTFVRFCFSLLDAGGKLVLTHKNREKTFSPLPVNWLCDWKFVP
ncbi:MAG: class I SAM-dependent methyltransferase, partial [Candidatus Omnitrophota bacterium]